MSQSHSFNKWLYEYSPGEIIAGIGNVQQFIMVDDTRLIELFECWGGGTWTRSMLRTTRKVAHDWLEQGRNKKLMFPDDDGDEDNGEDENDVEDDAHDNDAEE